MITLLAGAVVVAGCTNTATSAGTSARPASTAGSAAIGTLGPPTSGGPAANATAPDDTTPISLDSSLLAVLPERLGDIAVAEDNDQAAIALSDPALPHIATAVDAAVAVDAANGNLVYAWVVKLRPGALTADAFRQWRDSYDDGACAASGGVIGAAEAELGGRTTYIGSCAAGLRTYHVWLEEADVLVSAASIGEGRFGEALIAGLREPS